MSSKDEEKPSSGDDPAKAVSFERPANTTPQGNENSKQQHHRYGHASKKPTIGRDEKFKGRVGNLHGHIYD
jgi:hypothetical protein